MLLFVLFLVQRRGTAAVGGLFGPVMLVWFAVLAILGIWGIAQQPRILLALNPLYGIAVLVTAPWLATPAPVQAADVHADGITVSAGVLDARAASYWLFSSFR